MTRHLGDVVREHREAAGLSQTRLARRSGVAMSLINRLEAHKHHSMSEENLAKIAQALGTTMPELLAETTDGQVRQNEKSLEQWLEDDGVLTPSQRQVVIDVYRGLARIE